MGVPSPLHVLEQELCLGQGELLTASSHGVWGIFHRLRLLLTCWKRVCCALWNAPLSHSMRRPSRYLIPKVPSGHQSCAEPITPSWAPPQPGTAIGFGRISESGLAQAYGAMAAEIQAPVGWAGWCQGVG